MPTEHFKLKVTTELIERFKGGWEHRARMGDIRKVLDLLTEGHLFLGAPLTEGTIFFRGRLLRNRTPFTNVTELTHRKASDIFDFGRCNAPGEAVLYASSNLETVFSELAVQVDDWVQVITLRKRQGAEIRCTVVGDIDHVRRHGRASLGGEGYTEAVKNYWASLTEVERLRLNVADAFVADKFRAVAKNSTDYKITAAFSSIIFQQGFDAFYYPSVGHLGGWNIAISEQAFSDGFEVVESEVREVFETLGYGIYGSTQRFRCIDVKNGRLNMQPVPFEHTFPSFDDFLLFNLNQPGQNIIFFQVLRVANGDFIRQHEPTNLSQPADFEAVVQLTINGRIPLDHNVGFDTLSKFISQNTDSWDYVVCQVTSGDTPEELQRQLADFSSRIASGDTSVNCFDRNGKAVKPIFGTPARKVE